MYYSLKDDRKLTAGCGQEMKSFVTQSFKALNIVWVFAAAGSLVVVAFEYVIHITDQQTISDNEPAQAMSFKYIKTQNDRNYRNQSYSFK